MLYHLIHLYTLEARNDEATDCHIRLETINMTIIFTRSTLGKNNRTAFDRILKYIKCIYCWRSFLTLPELSSRWRGGGDLHLGCSYLGPKSLD